MVPSVSFDGSTACQAHARPVGPRRRGIAVSTPASAVLHILRTSLDWPASGGTRDAAKPGPGDGAQPHRGETVPYARRASAKRVESAQNFRRRALG